MKITFRQFKWKEDIKDVLGWHKDMVKIDFPDSMYKENLYKKILKKEHKQEPEGMMLVMDGSKKIGLLWLNTRYDEYREKKYGYVHYVYLIPEYRGKGLGKKLMHKTDHYFFKKKKIDIIQLGTGAHNISSQKLYERIGYEPRRIIFEKYRK